MSLIRQSTPDVPTSAKPPSCHHVGFVVRSIAEAGPGFARSTGAEWGGEIIVDPSQEAKVSFMSCGDGHAPLLELVEPDKESSRLQKFVDRGGGLHHICYEVDSLKQQLIESRKVGCLIVKQPTPAVAFGGRPIAWVYTREKLLIEYLER